MRLSAPRVLRNNYGLALIRTLFKQRFKGIGCIAVAFLKGVGVDVHCSGGLCVSESLYADKCSLIYLKECAVHIILKIEGIAGSRDIDQTVLGYRQGGQSTAVVGAAVEVSVLTLYP